MKLYPDFPQALTELGRQYLLLNQMDRASETYRALVKLKQADASAHLNLGIALYNVSLALQGEKKTEEANQRLAEAEQALRQSLALKCRAESALLSRLTMIRFRSTTKRRKRWNWRLPTVARPCRSRTVSRRALPSAKRNKEPADHLEKYLQLEPKRRRRPNQDTIKDLRAKS